jgi:hypothetical protein
MTVKLEDPYLSETYTAYARQPWRSTIPRYGVLFFALQTRMNKSFAARIAPCRHCSNICFRALLQRLALPAMTEKYLCTSKPATEQGQGCQQKEEGVSDLSI